MRLVGLLTALFFVFNGGSIHAGECADAATEAAVMKALRWLKATQSAYGSWGEENPKLGLTRRMDKAAGAGFALLTFLAHGETPISEEFGPTVQKALDYLIKGVYVVKNKKGDERKDPNGKRPYIRMTGAGGSEYGFLIATYALCEAYGIIGDPRIREPAEMALTRIVSGQTPTGGWNYNMVCVTRDGPDDLSYGGWAMQALKAGKMSGLDVPNLDACMKKAVKCLQERNYSQKAGFVYRATTNHKGGSGGLAGVGCYALQLFGDGTSRQARNALRVMRNWHPTFDAKHVTGGENCQYYSYYATRCKYLAGKGRNARSGDVSAWKKWDKEMKVLYLKAIITVTDESGKEITVKDPAGRERPIGYWQNKDHYNYDVMATCLTALQLMAPYPYLQTTSLKKIMRDQRQD